MARIDHAAIAERANPQLGLVTTAQLRYLGLTKDHVFRLTQSGYLRRVRPGVHAIATVLSPAIGPPPGSGASTAWWRARSS